MLWHAREILFASAPEACKLFSIVFQIFESQFCLQQELILIINQSLRLTKQQKEKRTINNNMNDDGDAGPTPDPFGLGHFLPGSNGGDEQRPSSPGRGLNQSSLGGNGGVEQCPDKRNNFSPDPIEERNAFCSFSNPVGCPPYQ